MNDTTHHQPAGGAERPAAPPIVPADLHEGDEVTLRATVLKTQDAGYVVLQLRGAPQAGYLSCFQFPISGLVTHTPKPKPLTEGDRAYSPQLLANGLILAIRDGLAWFEVDGLATRKTLMYSDLLPIQEPRPLAPGDTVLVLEPLGGDYPRMRMRASIIAIRGSLAWVEGISSSKPSFVTEVSKLERAFQWPPFDIATGKALDGIANDLGVPPRFTREPDNELRRRIQAFLERAQ